MNERARTIAVIGASPLLITVAIRYQRAGFDVTIVDKKSDIGGCWSVRKTGSSLAIEEAGHLLEWYSGGYKLFAERFEIDMEEVFPSPLVVKKNGNAVLHTSRTEIALAFFEHSTKLIKGSIRVLCPGIVSRSERLKSLKKFFRSYKFFLKYKLPALSKSISIHQPTGGFVNFHKHLLKLLKHNQIKFMSKEIVRVDINDSHCSLKSKENSYLFDKVITGESVETEIYHNGDAVFHDPRTNFMSYHWVCEINAGKIKRDFTYIYFPYNKFVNRITRTGTRSKLLDKIQILVQLREDLNSEKFVSVLNEELIKLQIISEPTQINVLLVERKCHPFPINSSKFDFIKMKDRFELVETYGDLMESLIRLNKDKS